MDGLIVARPPGAFPHAIRNASVKGVPRPATASQAVSRGLLAAPFPTLLALPPPETVPRLVASALDVA